MRKAALRDILVLTIPGQNVALACGGWKRRDIVLELGGVLRARTAQGSADISANHSLFSSLVFDKFDAGAGELAEEDGADVEEARNAQLEILPRQGSDGESVRKVGIEEVGGGWLEGDEIEEDWD